MPPKRQTRKGEGTSLIAWDATNELGTFAGELHGEATGLEQYLYKVTFTPSRPVHIPYLPRDLIGFHQPLAYRVTTDKRY